MQTSIFDDWVSWTDRVPCGVQRLDNRVYWSRFRLSFPLDDPIYERLLLSFLLPPSHRFDTLSSYPQVWSLSLFSHLSSILSILSRFVGLTSCSESRQQKKRHGRFHLPDLWWPSAGYLAHQQLVLRKLYIFHTWRITSLGGDLWTKSWLSMWPRRSPGMYYSGVSQTKYAEQVTRLMISMSLIADSLWSINH